MVSRAARFQSTVAGGAGAFQHHGSRSLVVACDCLGTVNAAPGGNTVSIEAGMNS
jgi:hypothetical protein